MQLKNNFGVNFALNGENIFISGPAESLSTVHEQIVNYVTHEVYNSDEQVQDLNDSEEDETETDPEISSQLINFCSPKDRNLMDFSVLFQTHNHRNFISPSKIDEQQFDALKKACYR